MRWRRRRKWMLAALERGQAAQDEWERACAAGEIPKWLERPIICCSQCVFPLVMHPTPHGCMGTPGRTITVKEINPEWLNPPGLFA